MEILVQKTTVIENKSKLFLNLKLKDKQNYFSC